MKDNCKKHLISINTNLKEALNLLNNLALDVILFVVDNKLKLIGSLTDGDVRRGLIKGLEMTSKVELFIQKDPKYVVDGSENIKKIIELRDNNFKIIPVLNKDLQVVNILNLRIQKSSLPIDVVVMAGGKGTRLKPLTDHTPKPLLKIGNKTIIDYNVDRLISYGINNFWITVCY